MTGRGPSPLKQKLLTPKGVEMELVTNCPRCGAQHITLDVPGINRHYALSYQWQHSFEVFGVCRKCRLSSIHVVTQRDADDASKKHAYSLAEGQLPALGSSLDVFFKVAGPVTTKDNAGNDPPEHLPNDIDRAFREGATCCVVKCWNAAGAMFRLCIDLATKAKLPPEDRDDIKPYQRAKLSSRLAWMFDHSILPADLQSLSTCLREDGNDGAHDGTLSEADALDLEEFAIALLERLYTEPEKLKLAERRRKERRQPKA